MKKPSDMVEVRESFFYNKNAKQDIKIASVGDIHISKTVGNRDINNIVESLSRENPDYVCLLGDLIDSPRELNKEEGIENLNNLIKSCSGIAPTMIILGNHDYERITDLSDKSSFWSETNKLSDVYILIDEVYNDDKIIIGGSIQKEEVYNKNRYDKHIEDSTAFYRDLLKHPNLYTELRNDLPKIFLNHSPESINDHRVQELLNKYDIVISGHYHNGCVPAFLENIYPKNAGIITPKLKLFPKQARGVIELDNGTYLIYSGGWTKLSESSPSILHPFDMICNRQIDVATLTSNEEYKREKIKTKKLVLKK